MSHGRTLYRCGCVRVQCRCPGPHRDTVLPVDCLKHRQERAQADQATALHQYGDERDRLIDEARD